MLKPRLIPALLIRNGGLVKTQKFLNPKYVGDPINAVRIFNEKAVDELVVFDIDATVLGKPPDYKLIGYLANECRMPLAYGGGVKTTEQIERIIGLGVEKVSVSAATVHSIDLISKAASRVGSQSIVVTIDVKKTGFPRKYEVVTHNGTIRTSFNPIAYAALVEGAGAGEIIINSVDRDGMMQGYDMELISKICDKISIPMTILGGAGTLGDIELLWKKQGLIGAAAGSLFVFKGKYRAVLINYPNLAEKSELLLRSEFKV